MELKRVDSKIFKLIEAEKKRQAETLMMIPSENHASLAVMEAVGSILGNKYSEGYPGARYYQGNELYDEIEKLAVERAKELFEVEYVNVQPYSGTPANAAIYMALLQPGETILSMDLPSGGHLSHGHSDITFGGSFYNAVHYGVTDKGIIDFEELEKLAKEVKPKLIVAGYSAYPRLVDFAKFAKIADSVGAWLMADISHISGLVVGRMHPSPAGHADVIMTTTHKTLRGPRGAMIMLTKKGIKKDKDLIKKINKAVFPGMQGGPHNNTIAGIAVALAEAQKSGFKAYSRRIVQNANVLATELLTLKWELASGGTDTHLLLADMRPFGVTGKLAAVAMEQAGLVMNANSIPHDPAPPYRPSGLRFGTPAITTRGMSVNQMKQIAEWMNRVMEAIRGRGESTDGLFQIKVLHSIANEVSKMAAEFPVPGVMKDDGTNKD